ncbi:MAG: T9SS type A sorting domain-containing protein, partial [Nitrosopumilus sp.]|nr:T9SS type A sorting domain-containing protein [Nitrosopumilus sp.]
MKNKIFLITALLFILKTSTFAQWTIINSGTSNSLNRVDFPSVNVGYVLPFNGQLLRTVNGGTTWDSLSSLTLIGDPWFDSNDISFVNDSVGFVTTHNNNGNIKLYKTTDMANTWMDLTPDSNLWGFLKVQFLNYQRGYLYLYSTAGDRSWITNDGGATWTELALGFGLGSGTSSIPTMFFVNDSSGYLAGGDGSFGYQGKIARTNDAGQSWSLTILPAAYTLINSIHFPNKDTGYVVTRNGGIFRSADEGSTWDSITTLNITTYSRIFFTDGSTGFIISGSNIYKTLDAGLSWTIDFSSATGINLNGVDFLDNTVGYVVGNNGTIVKNSISNGIENLNSTKDLLTIYPNPFSMQTTLQTDKIFKDATLTVYNSFGQQLKQIKNISGQTVTLFRDNLPSGLYVIRLAEVDK